MKLLGFGRREKGHMAERMAPIKKQRERDTARVTLKGAGPDTEQLKEERLP